MLHSPLAIANVFKRLRKRHLDKPNLTTIGDLIGVSQQTMGSLENGSSHHWTRERVTKLCNFYGITLKEFDELAKAEDTRLDNPERSIHDADADPDEVAAYQKFLKSVNPRLQRIESIHRKLADELPPKKYEALLNKIALENDIDIQD